MNIVCPRLQLPDEHAGERRVTIAIDRLVFVVDVAHVHFVPGCQSKVHRLARLVPRVGLPVQLYNHVPVVDESRVKRPRLVYVH